MNKFSRIFGLAILTAGLVTLTFVSAASISSKTLRRLPNDNGSKEGKRSREKRSSDDYSSSQSNGNRNRNQNSNNNSNRNGNSNVNSASSGISIDEARRIALEKVPGTVVKEEFENKKGRSVYEFYIRTSDGEVFEVKIDASNGNVLEVEGKDS